MHRTRLLSACALIALCWFPAGAAAQSAGQKEIEPVRDIPEPLAELERSRAWKKARVIFMEKRGSGPRYYGAVVSGSDVLLTQHGDEEGVVSRYPDGTPQPYGYFPFHQLYLGKELWLYGEGQIRAEVLVEDKEGHGFDLRTLGLAPSPYDGGRLERALRPPAAGGRFETVHEGGCIVVRLDSGSFVTRWQLDPRRGGEAVRVTREEKSGKVLAECRSEPADFNGTWFPARLEYFRSNYRGGHEPERVIEVAALEVDPADVPDRLTPAFIGIDAGVNLYRRRVSALGAVESLKWDGTRGLTLEEYSEAWQAGKIREGPIYRANLELADEAVRVHEEYLERSSGRASSATTAPAAGSLPAAESLLETLTGWEAYTHRFIERYRLDAGQAERAISILRQCQELGQAYLRRVSDRVDEWNRLMETARTSGSFPPADAERAGRLREQIAAPLEAIFRSQLQPRLNTLPTRAQRKAAEAP